MLEDLRTPVREVLDHPARHAGDVRSPALDRIPPDLQTLTQLRPERRLIQVARGLGMAVEHAAVERRPAPVRGLRRVRDHDVRVQQRIARTRGAMPERRGNEPAPLDLHGASVPAARATCLALHVAERLRDGRFVSANDLSRDRRLGDARTGC